MDGGTVGLRIASAVIAPLLKRLLLPPAKAPGAHYQDRPIPVRRLMAFSREHRTLTEDDLHRIARELVRRAVRAAGPYDPPVGPDEKDAVGLALTRTLHALGDLDMDDVQAFALGPEKLAAELSRRAGPETRRLLSDDAARFHDRLLETACVHVVRFFSEQPGFAARTQVEQSREVREQSERLDRILERLPDISAQDARFEEDYARYVVQCHGKLTIHGVDLREPAGQEWPLEDAYLSLEATPYRSGPSEAAPLADGESPERAAAPVETTLATHDRVLLRGVAGTGKTTLVQWLALTTARQERMPGSLSQLLGRVPFVLPLRALARKGAELPMPQDFLRWIDCPLLGTEPEGWATRVLQNGRAVMLIDGADEIPKGERGRVKAWLKKLLAVFPGNLWLLTSRPSALEQGWLRHEGFNEFVLSAMPPADMRRFIERWHAAAGAPARLGESLTLALRSRPELSRLATNPLMCGLICALHRERRGFLPRGRASLYEAALAMLLERRDVEREVYGGGDGAPQLDQRSATEPLRSLAYWLIRNERTQLDRADAVGVVRRLMPSVERLAEIGEAEDVLQLLLERSGLLREPAQGAVDFIHRTFQDFLGAQAVLEERDMGMLVNNAHLEHWEDVVQMVVAQARHHERGELLTRLRERGERERDPAVQARLRLLALASLEQATSVAPAVREAIEGQAARMVPPRSLREARALAQTGPLLLGLLPDADALSGDEELATVHAICQIGGDAAIPRLRQFLHTGQSAVRAQLLHHWDRFDPEVYAEEIVRPLLEIAPEEMVTVRSRAELDALRTMSGYQRVSLRGDFTPDDVRSAFDGRRLRELQLRDILSLDSLDVLSGYPELESVGLRGCRNVQDPAPLTRLPRLRRLALRDLPRFEPLHELAGCARLDTLLIGADVPWRGLADLPCPGRLQVLSLPPTATRLSDIAACESLTELHLQEASERLTPDSWGSDIGKLPGLRTLTLTSAQLSMLLFAPRTQLPHVTRLNVHAGAGAAVPLRRIALRLPGLEEIHLLEAAEVDLASLASLHRLRKVRLAYPGEVRGTEALAGDVELSIYPQP
ncbi:NACHT domain-containing protein [Streptomyces sp. BG9H]|uniref:NACHT domain-containing protein n=1 Tax=Streptomyces anatolicus TaxID=2675858 RepID=A0ABS6YUI9_9ACTN|nr:NACHT domain-containing protein [Streptomyces anatolicus]MBW5425093.1 NACHT domain-containing protein [Streptomyces anatolicus]